MGKMLIELDERIIFKVFHGLLHHFQVQKICETPSPDLVIRSRRGVAGVGHQERQAKHVVDALLLVGGQDLSCTVQLPLRRHWQTDLGRWETEDGKPSEMGKDGFEIIQFQWSFADNKLLTNMFFIYNSGADNGCFYLSAAGMSRLDWTLPSLCEVAPWQFGLAWRHASRAKWRAS